MTVNISWNHEFKLQTLHIQPLNNVELLLTNYILNQGKVYNLFCLSTFLATTPPSSQIKKKVAFYVLNKFTHKKKFIVPNSCLMESIQRIFWLRTLSKETFALYSWIIFLRTTWKARMFMWAQFFLYFVFYLKVHSSYSTCYVREENECVCFFTFPKKRT